MGLAGMRMGFSWTGLNAFHDTFWAPVVAFLDIMVMDF